MADREGQNAREIAAGQRFNVSDKRGRTYTVPALQGLETKVYDVKKSVNAASKTKSWWPFNAIHSIAITAFPPGQDPDSKDSKGIKLNNANQTLKEAGVPVGSTFRVSNLGPQIGYRTVFIVEYLGPILIVLLYALRPSLIYGAAAKDAAWNPVALAGVAAWVAHFVKREYETLYVHKFSRPTMPLSNLFKNSIYYWGFALFVGYPLCHPEYTSASSMEQIVLGGAIMAASELVNYMVHVHLSNMRPAEGSTKRDVPSGALFSLVSCPNYTAEVLSWVGFSIMMQIAASYAFTVVGFLQMTEWAIKKHKGYRSDSKGTEQEKLVKGRTAIVPFVI